MLMVDLECSCHIVMMLMLTVLLKLMDCLQC
jgi:hypothetical protein